MRFLTTEDIRQGRKVLGAKGPIRGRILTPIGLSGDMVKIAEDGQKYPSDWIVPLTEDQIHEELVQSVVSIVEGKSIVNLQAKGRGVSFILEDNTRVTLDYAKEGNLKLSITDAVGNKVL